MERVHALLAELRDGCVAPLNGLLVLGRIAGVRGRRVLQVQQTRLQIRTRTLPHLDAEPHVAQEERVPILQHTGASCEQREQYCQLDLIAPSLPNNCVRRSCATRTQWRPCRPSPRRRGPRP